MIALLSALTLAWTPSPGINIADYLVYCGTNSGVYLSSTNVGRVTSWTSTNLTGLWFFTVTCRTSNGIESLPSNEVAVWLPPYEPAVRTNVVSLVIYAGSNFVNWMAFCTNKFTNISAWTHYRMSILSAVTGTNIQLSGFTGRLSAGPPAPPGFKSTPLPLLAPKWKNQ